MPGVVAAASWLGKMYSKKRWAVTGEAHSRPEASMTLVAVAGTGPLVCESKTVDTEATMPAGDG